MVTRCCGYALSCGACCGNGIDEDQECEFCRGQGYRAMTQDEIDDAAEDAFSDMCEGEPPVSLDEQHRAAWKQKQELRR